MPDFNFVLLYVDNPPKSAAFYTDLLGKQTIENSPMFAMLPLSKDVLLGLWQRDDVAPKAEGGAYSGEIAFTVADADAVRATFEDWRKRGLNIIQEPTQMDFGVTFTALDPDGHRIRVFARPTRQ